MTRNICKFVLLILILLFAHQPALCETVRWVSPNGGRWEDSSHWSVGRVPAESDDVVIDTLPEAEVITLTDADVRVLSIQSSAQLALSTHILAVSKTSTLRGLRLSSGATLEVSGAGSQFSVTGQTDIANSSLKVSGGAVVNLPFLTRYDTTRYSPQATVSLLSVEGQGSRLNLSSVSEVFIGVNGITQVIQASNGGVIDFSGLTSVVGNIGLGYTGSIEFRTLTGGQILLPNLQSMTVGSFVFDFENGVTPLSNVRELHSVDFTVGSGETFSFPNLEKLYNASLSLTSGATFSAPKLTELSNSTVTLSGTAHLLSGMLTNIDNTRFYLSQGASFSRIAAETYALNTLNQRADEGPVLSVSENATLDLSSVLQFNVGQAYFNYMLSASSGGTINFANLQSIIAVPIGYPGNVILHSDSGGKLLLPSLETMTGGSFVFDFENGVAPLSNLRELQSVDFIVSNGETLTFPNLEKLYNVSLSLASGSTFSAPNLKELIYSTVTLQGTAKLLSGMLTNIDNTRFYLSQGASFDRVAAETYALNALNQSANEGPVLSVSENSTLDLSSVLQFNVGQPNFSYLLSTSSGGTINFANLQSIGGVPIGYPGDVTLHSDSGGKLLLPSLESMTGNSFVLDFENGVTPLQHLRELYSVNLLVQSGETISFPNLVKLHNASLSLRSGAVFNAPNLTALTSSRLTLEGTAQMLSGMLSSIDNTRFHLSRGASYGRIAAKAYSSRELNESSPDDPIILVTENSSLDLSSVEDLNLGKDLFAHYFISTHGSTLDLSGVSVVNLALNYTSSQVAFLAQDLGKILLSKVAFLDSPSLSFVSESSGIIDLSSLCSYLDVSFTERTDGQIVHQAVPDSHYFRRAVFGVMNADPESACQLAGSCEESWIVSFLPNTGCYEERHAIRNFGQRSYMDGLAVSESYGLRAFLMIISGGDQTTSSRLISIDHKTGSYRVLGPSMLDRDIRGATFIADTIVALDTRNGELLKIRPTNGEILSPPVPVTLRGARVSFESNVDLAFTDQGSILLLHGDTFYSVDLNSGELTQLFVDTALFPNNDAPGYGGIAINPNGNSSSTLFFGLHLGAQNNVVNFAAGFSRSIFRSNIFDSPDRQVGDLASVVSFDDQPPGHVAITGNGALDGRSAELTWLDYDEAANGNDIDVYVIYQSAAPFTDSSQGVEIGRTRDKRFLVDGLDAGSVYYFGVVAIDSSANVDPTLESVRVEVTDALGPPNVESLSLTSQRSALVLSWEVPSNATDIQGFRLYQDDQVLADGIPALARNYSVVNLAQGEFHSFRIVSLDAIGNESSGREVGGVTWLPNPTGVVVEPAQNSALVSWDRLASAYVQEYRIYVQENPFQSVQGLTQIGSVSAAGSSFVVPALGNGRSYHIAVVTVNTSGGFDPVVQSYQVVPQRDVSGPIFEQLLFGGAPLSSNAVISGNQKYYS